MFRVAVVGATGAVGGTMMRVLEERGFPVSELRPLASQRSNGKEIDYLGKTCVVRTLTEDAFDGIDIALFSAGGDRARQFAPAAVEAGAVVVDNSSAFAWTRTCRSSCRRSTRPTSSTTKGSSRTPTAWPPRWSSR